MFDNNRERKVFLDSTTRQNVKYSKINSESAAERRKVYWSKLRVFSKVIGRLLIIYKELKTFGSSKRSNFSVKSEEEAKTRFVLHPKSRFKIFWNSIIFILLLYTATILPYRICFEMLQSPEWGILDLCVDLVFFIDIIINFNTATISLTEKITFSRAEIAKKYLKSWFVVDLLSCIPLDFIITNESNTSLYKYLLRVLRVTKMYRIIKVLRLLKLFRLFRASFIQTLFIQNYFQANTRSTISFVVQISLFVHISACIWYYISTTGDLNPSSWLIYDLAFDKPPSEVYLACIYFVFTTFTTIGYGDITPYSNSEKVFTMVLMGFGVSFYSYMISSLSVSIKKQDTAMACMKTKKKQFMDLAKVMKLSDKIKTRINLYLKRSVYQDYKDIHFVDEILGGLPSNIKDMILTHVNMRHIAGIQFFCNKKSTFVNAIAHHLQLCFYQYKDIIFEEGEIPIDVYFIKKGRVVLKVNPNIAFRVYTQGGYFGEIEVIFKINREHTAKVCSESAEIYSINKVIYLDILEKYIDYYDSTKAIAEARRMKHNESIFEVLSDENLKDSTLESKNILDLTFSIENSKFNRNDTGVKTSVKHDTPFKRKNRRLWKTALLGSPIQDFKDLKKKRSTSIQINRESFSTTAAKINNFFIKNPAIEDKFIKKPIEITEVSDLDFSEEISQLDIKEAKSHYFGSDTVEEFSLLGSRYRTQSIEEKVISIKVNKLSKQVNTSSDLYNSLSSLLIKIEQRVKK